MLADSACSRQRPASTSKGNAAFRLTFDFLGKTKLISRGAVACSTPEWCLCPAVIVAAEPVSSLGVPEQVQDQPAAEMGAEGEEDVQARPEVLEQPQAATGMGTEEDAQAEEELEQEVQVGRHLDGTLCEWASHVQPGSVSPCCANLTCSSIKCRW